MTLKAREVLQDCREAIDELDSNIQGSVWRRRWITAVVLLRTVGYVLDKIDSGISVEYKQAINNEWSQLNKSKEKHPIFFDFIEEERNNILKEYKTSAGQGVTVYVGFGDTLSTSKNHYLMYGGKFEGREQREILIKAVKWWEDYLDKIDKSVKN